MHALAGGIMFTGLITHFGIVVANIGNAQGMRLTIDAPFSDLEVGESIAIHGVCLTVLPLEAGKLVFDLSPETLQITMLNTLKAGDKVHLERAMQASTRFGGHYVSGHVDTKAIVQQLKYDNAFLLMVIGGFDTKSMRYLLPKGSITVNGVSLTINQVNTSSIELMLIPHTLEKTTLGTLQLGQSVNIEFDYLTRIIAHQLSLMAPTLTC
jgi:riboflavin synthase